MRLKVCCVLALAAGLVLGSAAAAAVKPNALIGENMVLQQGAKAPVWGTADNGEEVKVTFGGKTYTTTAQDGKWRVDLLDLKPGGPFEMTIAGKGNPIVLKNVLVGEVWVCSGQSNMEWHVLQSSNPGKTLAACENPKLRLFTVPKKMAETPQTDVDGTWKLCEADNLYNFSAVAYFFGRDLEKALGVPVGLINTSWGGTVAEAWTSPAALEANPDLKYLNSAYDDNLKKYSKGLEGYLVNLDKHKTQVMEAVAAGKKAPAAPLMPQHPSDGPNQRPSSLYNGMIAPLIPYAIKGAIWYQGESNAGRAYEYRTLFPVMIADWRKNWGEGDFPFLFVQLAPFASGGKPDGLEWPELREAQMLTAKNVKNTAMAVITDVGDEKDIHPRQKETVGKRLGLGALALAYGKKVEYTGPVYKGMKVDGNKAVLSFEGVGGGLVAKDGPLTGFTICGEDQKFVKAEAEVKGDTVVVWSKDVSKPVAVRFGWANYTVTNLFNKDGLPASPFRTDDFAMVTKPK